MESSSMDLAPAMVAVPREDAVLQSTVALPVDVTGVAVAVLQQRQQLAQAVLLPQAVLLLESVAVQYALELDSEQTEEDSLQQPLKEILREHSVTIFAHNEDTEGLYKTLAQLEQLIRACNNSPSNFGRSPGWDLRLNAHDDWTSNPSLPLYESLKLIRPHATDLPLPTPQSAKRVFEKVKKALEVRLQYLLQSSSSKSEYCSCTSTWWEDQVAVRQIVNQVMEQAMTEQASCYLHRKVPFHTCHATYGHSNTISQNTSLDRLDSPIQLISHRDLYMNVLVQAMLAARHSVFISTCYLFHEDPAPLYLLFDVIPTLLQSGIQVYFMMDLFVFESNMLSSPFRVQPKTTSPSTAPSNPQNENVTLLSFLRTLPPHAPQQTPRRFESQYHVFDALLQQSNTRPNFHMSFWCARDRHSGYRIKNHSKGIVIDDQWAMFGGSNLAPTLRTATGDLDCVVTGPAAKAIGDGFWKLWQAVNGKGNGRLVVPPNNNALLTAALVQGGAKESLSEGATSTVVPECTMSLLQSTPSSAGDDCIYRGVLEHIELAKESITISMGHCCFPQSFVCALKRAASRGVDRIQILVNSFHSNDLRCGQRDLFLSTSDLLQQVPSAQIYATHGDNPTVRPDFLHGKYVIVDGVWAALGSWNLWTRSSFYELEMELFIDSAGVAAILQSKFDADRAKAGVLVELEDCETGGKFCPKGCPLCRGFGPFFEKS